MMREGEFRNLSGCAISGIFSKAGVRFSGEKIIVPKMYDGLCFIPMGEDFVFSYSAPDETKSGEITVLQKTAGNNFIFNKSIMINKI